MKGGMRLQMFHQMDDLLQLIVKRCVSKRCIRLACLILIAQQCSPTALCQPTRSEAVNLRDHIYRGNTCLGRRDYDGALSEYEAALEIEPSNVTARDNIVLTHNNWGIDLFRQKKYEEAKEQWETALKLNPYDRNAKNNLAVLKTTLARLGPAAAPSSPGSDEKGSGLPGESDSKSGPSILPKGAQAPKEDNTPAPHAVILNRPAADSSPTATAGSGSSGGVVILNSGARQAPPQKDNPYASSSTPAAPPQRDNPYASSSAPPAPPAKNNPYADTPPAPPPQAPAASSSSSSTLGAANIDDKLSALETKVYGHASKETPLLQRLEHLERDTSSRPSLGSINDRVQTLLKTYGL